MTKKIEPLKVHTQAELADACGVSVRTVHKWQKRWEAEGVDWWDPDAKPGKRQYPLPCIFQWLIGDTGPWRQTPPLSAADSEALERYRLAKAQLAELDLLQRKGIVMTRLEARGILWRWGDIIKDCKRKLFNRHGLAARQIIDRAVDRCQQLLDQELGPGSEKTRP